MVLWPPRSPDLSPADFFLWGHLKGIVYKNNPPTLDDLRSLQVLHRIASSMGKRARGCSAEQGSHFEHLL
ncbi:hypothetical protein B7P43_G07073 [Cryptotermes secundus]|uniref:Uncharacterized protein n=1 Tax=Cryptotermes secundus TaxID=105785 RepID=A0A2J7RHC3_9NEOP|nr:hypothetical protein B7P43_G07073 [Cryptotermes secundus]